MIWTLGASAARLCLPSARRSSRCFWPARSLTFVFFLTVPSVALHQIMFGGLENYALLAIPFFIFAGELMGARRHRRPADRLGAGLDRPRSGRARRRDGRRLDADRRDFRRKRRDRRGGRQVALSRA